MAGPKIPREQRGALASYLRAISRYPLLTASREHRLAHRTRRGEWGARNELVQSNLRLVVKIAREYANSWAPIEDLISEGNLGLIEAVRRYDPRRGVRFAAYAAWWIRKYVRGAWEHHRKAASAPLYEPGATGREGALRLWRRLSSLEEPRTTSGASALESRLAAPDPGPEETLREAEIASVLRELIARLPEDERRVLRARYGLAGGAARTLTEIGHSLGCTREWARQIELRAIGRLRRILRHSRRRW